MLVVFRIYYYSLTYLGFHFASIAVPCVLCDPALIRAVQRHRKERRELQGTQRRFNNANILTNYSSFKYFNIEAAPSFPACTASTTSLPPFTQSPPANTPSIFVEQL